MDLTQDEKTVLKHILDGHISEVEKNENLADSPPVLLAAEIKYEQLLKDLRNKLG
ncbi:hypothetical protein ISS07_04700 [Candidatus Woesearchaeota archaeon]|nr:hypothetical protein [Candidatus Woesearchaeota archaeon]